LAWWFIGLVCLGAVMAGVALGAILVQAGRTPREWAPYLQRRALGHRPLIVDTIDVITSWLIYADRLSPSEPSRLPALQGASPDRSGPPATGRIRLAASTASLSEAIATAEPGDVIQLLPGSYRLNGNAIQIRQGGTASAPITLRAARFGDVTIESDTVETFKVEAPFWRIENLIMQGICSDHSGCEHAFHVVGAATDTVFRNNLFKDYNAQIKINGENGRFPDRGVIEGNTFTDTAPRATLNPITPIDMVGASDWRIRTNIIADFVRDGGGAATYGAFVKGAGEGNVLERNLVACEWNLHNVPGPHVGLSLGGGGTDTDARRDMGRTGFEQIGGIVRDNLIVRCNDDGIYLNRAARSAISHNTLLDTAGIDARFVETSAVVTGNIVDGVVRTRDGATLAASDNATTWLLELFVGLHPERGYFRDPAILDLAWRKPPVMLPESEPAVDLCGRQPGDSTPQGAFADFSDCLVSDRRKPHVTQ
jgi:hypothetical protein